MKDSFFPKVLEKYDAKDLQLFLLILFGNLRSLLRLSTLFG